jgi:hypothetical protein
MPARTIIPVQQRRMRSNTVVPNHHSSWRPFHACLKVLALCDVVVEKVEKKVGLFFLVAYDATAELRVHEKRFLVCCRVRAHERMDGGYGIATNDAAAVLAVVSLLDSCDLSVSFNTFQIFMLTRMHDL